MEFTYRRHYRSSVKGVIFDWAGTTVDYGCMAPAGTFVELFQSRGVDITAQQAREPMGLHKRDHISAIAHMEDVARKWEIGNGKRPTEADIDSMFEQFVPALIRSIEQHSDVIPGTVDTVTEIRSKGIRIGSTTGYSREIMEKVSAAARLQGYEPEVLVCADEVKQARPAPWMAIRAAEQLGLYPLEALVKVGDTPADVAEGLNAGMWSVAVVRHGNEVGLSEVELSEVRPDLRDQRIAQAADRLARAGAHYVIDSIRDLPATIEAIEARLRNGEKP